MATYETSDNTDARWPTTTIWDLIRRSESSENTDEVTEKLALRYWRPVYAYLRRRGRNHHESADLTQDFFLALLTRGWVQRADESKGKFRVFLVTLLLRHIRDLEIRRQARFEKDVSKISIDIVESDEGLLNWNETASAEQAFWLQYVRDLLDRSLSKFRREVAEIDAVGYRIFQTRLEGEIDDRPLSWAELAAPFGITIDQARWAYRRVGDRFHSILARQLGSEGERKSDLQAAVSELFRIVCGSQG